jgi:2-methylcitrate dehydratase PrpD
MNNADIAQRLAEFSTTARFSDIPKETIEFTKGLCLKTVAGMVRGSIMPAGRRAIVATRERGHLAEVGVIGAGDRTSLWNAVLNHAFFAHASELEDDRFGGLGTCWDITVLPITFTLADKLQLSGRELLEISAVGLEVHARTCLFYPQGYMGMTVIPGAMGPAAAAGRALKLDAAQMVAALGLSMSSAPIAYTSFGTDSHYFESAMQSLQGLLAAELARQGATGNPDIVTYMSNLIGKERVKPELILRGLGSEWLLNGIWIKKYPCCFYLHRYLDAFLEVMESDQIEYQDIERVTVHISQVERCCDRPDPRNFDDLQFSFQHSHGVAMIDRDVNFSHISEKALEDPKYREARRKVNVVFHPEWVSTYAMGTPAQLEVQLKGGRVLKREKNHVRGSPAEPLSLREFQQLFTKFTREVMPNKECEWVARALASLEELTAQEVKELIRILVHEVRPI